MNSVSIAKNIKCRSQEKYVEHILDIPTLQ